MPVLYGWTDLVADGALEAERATGAPANGEEVAPPPWHDAPMLPAEHRALRELGAFTGQLTRHWERWAGAATRRRSCAPAPTAARCWPRSSP